MHLSDPSLLAACAIGAAVEFGWAAGEAVLVPHLARRGVRPWVASTIYLANPTVGLWIQPRLGFLSDRIGRRVPFVVGLSSVALAGLAVLICAAPLASALGLCGDGGSACDGDGSAPPALVALSFAAFGAADVCFDCLLVPGRALLDDRAADAGEGGGRSREESHALFTGFQLGGRLLALWAGSSRWTASGLWGLYEGSDAHFEACLTLSALFLAGSLLAVVVLVEDKGPSYDVVPDEDSDAYVAIPEQSVEQEEKRGTSPSPPSNLDVDKAETDGIAPDQDYMSQSRRGSCIDASALLFTVQAAGWVSICASSFFWTSWRGEEAGCADLALQSVVGIVIAALLPRANAHLGPATVWLGSELSFHLLMISTMLASGSKGRSARAIGALSGVNYAVHATNGLIVATGLVPDPSRRARTIAMVNNALPAGQLVTAVTGGAIAQYFGGFEHSFVSYGFLGAIVTAMAWWISSRRGLFH